MPGLLAQLNSTALSLMDRLGVRNVARQMRYFDAHPEQALALLCIQLCYSEIVYFVPVDHAGKTDVWLRLVPARSRNQHGIKLAQDKESYRSRTVTTQGLLGYR